MTLRVAPAIDSGEHATARRRELDIPRDRAPFLGLSALEAARTGRYADDDGHTVEWRVAVEKAVAAKLSLPPDARLPEPPAGRFAETHVVVANETTLAAAHRLGDAGLRPLSLNFANGIEPGGARAQEEVLCRSSALLLTLDGDPMYDAHRRGSAYESSDWVILSRDVPVFRRDDGLSLPEPWLRSPTTLSCARVVPYRPIGIGHVKLLRRTRPWAHLSFSRRPSGRARSRRPE